MAVDTTIPNSSNNVGDDLSAIQENFELLASAQVVDEGSTADGDYIRYENGWQVCISKEFTLDATRERGSGVYSSSSEERKTWNYPFDFTNVLWVQGTSLRGAETDICKANGRGVDINNAATVYLFNIDGSQTDRNKNYVIAIGRWK